MGDDVRLVALEVEDPPAAVVTHVIALPPLASQLVEQIVHLGEISGLDLERPVFDR